MSDPRVEKLAKILVQYSLELKPGEEFAIQANPVSEELSLAVYQEAIKAGAHVLMINGLPGAEEVFLKLANDEQLDYIARPIQMIYKEFDALLNIWGNLNTRSLAGIDPARQQRHRRAGAELTQIFFERFAKGEVRWCGTAYPTHASAQEADMSLSDYQDFVYKAGMLDREDPVAAWREISARQQHLVDWLKGRQQVHIQGKNVDLTLSIQGRKFEKADGKENFPDGEIFTSPVEDSANGWIHFGYPAIFGGQEVDDIKLWFENGVVVQEKAAKGQEFLTAMLDTDEGSRRLGEFGIGTNYQITRFTKHMLFDEKIGGTIHLAVGAGFPEVGGQNMSSLHWDMLCDMSESEITVDGDLFYKDGKFAVQE